MVTHNKGNFRVERKNLSSNEIIWEIYKCCPKSRGQCIPLNHLGWAMATHRWYRYVPWYVPQLPPLCPLKGGGGLKISSERTLLCHISYFNLILSYSLSQFILAYVLITISLLLYQSSFIIGYIREISLQENSVGALLHLSSFSSYFNLFFSVSFNHNLSFFMN